ncbi:Aldehyde dehydrogenase (NAD+) OS=Castellaniella defragrans OX=75697 GN=HNR28_003424 PE=3 SV=1 [Castellaniella defragrans]
MLLAIEEIRIGHPLSPQTQMGTMANRAQFEKTRRYIEQAREAGGACDGRRPAFGRAREGAVRGTHRFRQRAARQRHCARRGLRPGVVLLQWSDESDAINLANSVQYGLTGSVWTRDVSRAHRLAKQLHSGYIWINDASSHFNGLPFGGYKSSGVGKEESKEEVMSYSQLKSVHLALGG